MSRKYQICTRCIMDTTDPDIEFDENGVCNHCSRVYGRVGACARTAEDREKQLLEVVAKIKKQGENKEYDCIIGLSGGVDSTYVAYLTKKLGLKPLAVHLDNGWDSQIAASNIENTVKKLGLNLYTYVIDWAEFKDLQLAYLKASVVDIEALTDHAILGALYSIANKRAIKNIIIGSNSATESILPSSWVYHKMDLVNLKDIHNKYGEVKLRTFPTLGVYKQAYYQHIKKIKLFSILNFVPYVRRDVIKVITRELDWNDYGGKHCESVFTRFYQSYILPEKFNIDKRRAHLSSLICSNQITREEALKEIKKPPYTEEGLKRDKEYVLSKLQLTNEEFERLMNLPIKSHLDYKSDIKSLKLLSTISSIRRKITRHMR